MTLQDIIIELIDLTAFPSDGSTPTPPVFAPDAVQATLEHFRKGFNKAKCTSVGEMICMAKCAAVTYERVTSLTRSQGPPFANLARDQPQTGRHSSACRMHSYFILLFKSFHSLIHAITHLQERERLFYFLRFFLELLWDCLSDSALLKGNQTRPPHLQLVTHLRQT